MRRQFVSRYGLVCEAKQSVLVNMYQFLTSVTSISKDVEKRLKFMLDSQDPDVIFNLRINNSGRPGMYAEFWSHARELIHEHALKAVRVDTMSVLASKSLPTVIILLLWAIQY